MWTRHASVAACALAVALAAGLLPCRGADVTPRDLLAKLSSQYYDLGHAGLARASCFVESNEVKVVDADGRTVRRRDEANPVTLRFSQYRVELRQ